VSEPEPTRLIVFGSRDWEDSDGALTMEIDLFVMHELARAPSVIIVHGACPTGADKIAADHQQRMLPHMRVYAEPHPADWKTHGYAAGPIRNREMARLGAKLAIGAWDGFSTGSLAPRVPTVGPPDARTWHYPYSAAFIGMMVGGFAVRTMGAATVLGLVGFFIGWLQRIREENSRSV
jgi:hypothetical protein